MKLHVAQKKIVEDTHRFRVLCAGRRFGKTVLSVEELVFAAITNRNANVVYIAPTYQSARDIAWDQLKKKALSISSNVNESRLEMEVRNQFGGNSKIFFRSWDNIETLRGQFFDFIVLDEVAQYRNFWIHWHEVLRATLTDRKGRALFISTPLGFNHFYDLFNTKDEDYKAFHFTSYDNPFIPKEEIDKAAKEIPEDRFAQEYLADFRKTEGLVYKEFDRNRHVTTEVPTNVSDTIIGIDFGYTNPSSIIPVKIDSDNNYWVLEEFYKTSQTTEQIAEYAKLYRPTKVYPDPAEPDRIETLRSFGLNCREVSKDIVAGVDRVRELFKQNRIHISPQGRNLIHELETYRYPDKKPDQNEQEKPVKENDHALDALRYALYMTSPIIEETPDPYYAAYGTYYRET